MRRPIFFLPLLDDLLKRLRKSGVGCHLINVFIGALLFADDLCLIAPTRKAMQIMLNICHEFCAEFGLSFNPRKSKTMVFGKNYSSSRASLFLLDEPIQFVNESHL